MATDKASPNGDPFQASWALYNELEALLSNEEVLLQLTHDALEDLILEKGNRLRDQLREDFLNLQKAMLENESGNQQTTDAVVGEPQGEGPVDDSEPTLPSTESASEAGVRDDALAVDGEDSATSADAVCPAADGAAHEVTKPFPEWSVCGEGLSGLCTVDDEIPSPPVPPNLRRNGSVVERHQTGSVEYKGLILINGVAAVMPQRDNRTARSAAWPLKLPCCQRPAFKMAYQTSNVIPRAA